MATKKKIETKIKESPDTAGQSTEEIEETEETKVAELVELSHKFSAEIQNIMTVEHLSFTNRARALGTATKYFIQQVDTVSDR